jgi:hypothetical protein
MELELLLDLSIQSLPNDCRLVYTSTKQIFAVSAPSKREDGAGMLLQLEFEVSFCVPNSS